MYLGLLVGSVTAYDNGVSQKPPLGWNSWCTMGMCGQGGVSPGKMSLHDVCNETEIKSIGEAMHSSGLYAMGYDRVNLGEQTAPSLLPDLAPSLTSLPPSLPPSFSVPDDCWVGENRSADGSLAWDPLRFPNGIKSLVDWLHGRGLKFGLYSVRRCAAKPPSTSRRLTLAPPPPPLLPVHRRHHVQQQRAQLAQQRHGHVAAPRLLRPLQGGRGDVRGVGCRLRAWPGCCSAARAARSPSLPPSLLHAGEDGLLRHGGHQAQQRGAAPQL